MKVMNLLSTMESDFVRLCQAICEGNLTQAIRTLTLIF